MNKGTIKKILFMFFVIGILLIFFSPNIGNILVYRYIKNNFGISTDLSAYYSLWSIYAQSLQFIGFLISLASVLIFISFNRKGM